jgi:DNA-directed RNA polymerase subunit M/transcription elongation factor TFIIS
MVRKYLSIKLKSPKEGLLPLKEMLNKYLKYNNAVIINRYLTDHNETKEDYDENLYEIVELVKAEKKPTGSFLKSILNGLFRNNLLWSHRNFDTIRTLEEEEDEFTTTPFSLEEGVLECYKCGSKKTFSYQRQTRSADEGATTFAECAMCGTKWRNNN